MAKKTSKGKKTAKRAAKKQAKANRTSRAAKPVSRKAAGKTKAAKASPRKAAAKRATAKRATAKTPTHGKRRSAPNERADRRTTRPLMMAVGEDKPTDPAAPPPLPTPIATFTV